MKKVKGNWGDIFRSKMNEQDVSVYAISKETKIPYNTVKRIINGVNEPKIGQFNLIVNYLNIKF